MQLFSWEFCEDFRNSFFMTLPRKAASVNNIDSRQKQPAGDVLKNSKMFWKINGKTLAMVSLVEEVKDPKTKSSLEKRTPLQVFFNEFWKLFTALILQNICELSVWLERRQRHISNVLRISKQNMFTVKRMDLVQRVNSVLGYYSNKQIKTKLRRHQNFFHVTRMWFLFDIFFRNNCLEQ